MDAVVFPGPYTRGAGQVDADRRRDLGQSHSPGKESEGGQGVRARTGTHRQRQRRRLRRLQVRLLYLSEEHIVMHQVRSLDLMGTYGRATSPSG